MKGRPIWFWALLSIIGLGALIVAGVIGFVVWQYREMKSFQAQADTHDLHARVQQMARGYLARRVNGALVIGVVQKGKTHWAGFGRVSTTNTNAPDAATLFEIGSVTKAFTGTALARMVEDGKLRLEDTIEKHLPPDLKLPDALRPITLVQLATHTAGLPRLPENLDLSDANATDPYARYTSWELYSYLRTAKLDYPPGRKSEYSNLGVGLLGHILSLRAGLSFEQLLREQVCAPLGMTDTVITLSPAQQARLTPGHDRKGNVVSNWTFDVLAPAGALRSTADDLLKFLQANLATNAPGLGPAMGLAQKTHFESWTAKLGLCWQIFDLPTVIHFYWHNGGTGGYVSFVAFSQRDQTGVVLLSNYGDAMSGDDALDEMGIALQKLSTKVSWE